MARAITNIGQFLMDDTAEKLLTVHGFSLSGSDYDRFRRLCVCLDRTVGSPVFDFFQEKFDSLSVCSQRLSQAHCNEIWRSTGDAFLLEPPTDATERVACDSPQILPPNAPPCAVKPFFYLNGLSFSAKNWDEWKVQAWSRLDSAVAEEYCPAVEIPSEISFRKPNRYAAERHLGGTETDESLWTAQLLYALCDYCRSRELRGGIFCRADASKLSEILQYVSKLTPLPDLILQWDGKDSDSLWELSRAILKDRQSAEEGIPPILWSNPQSH